VGASGSYFQVLVGVVREISETSLSTLTVGVLSIVLLLLLRRFLPKLPRTIIVVVVGIVVSDLLDLEDDGVSIVGEIPTRLPSFVFPNLPPVGLAPLLLGSLAIIFIVTASPWLRRRRRARSYDYEIDASHCV